jgi:hypothetical protein
VVAGLEHMPERLPLPLEGFLGLVTFGDVPKESDDARPLKVIQDVARDVGVEGGSIPPQDRDVACNPQSPFDKPVE